MQTQGMLEQHQALAQVAPHIRLGAPLRCDGPGRLDAAEDIRTGTPMAVRWIPLEAKGEQAAAAATALPRHPALPTVRLSGVASRHAWVALDYPEGRLLTSRLSEGMSAEWVGLVGETVAEAFALLHARGVVHGELSAESILLHGKHVVVWDLPLLVMGRICERRKEQRQVSRLHVTAPYLAPERLRGGAPSEAADVYALGVLVARMLGAPGPTAEAGLALVHQVTTGEWRPVVPPGTPAPLRPTLERMLDEEPEVRPSMAEVAARMRLAIPPPTRTEPEMPAIVLGVPQGGAPIQVAVAPPPLSPSNPFLPRTVSGDVPVLEAAPAMAAPRPAQDVAAGMTLPVEPPRPKQDVATGYALPVRARPAAVEEEPAELPADALEEVGGFEMPASFPEPVAAAASAAATELELPAVAAAPVAPAGLPHAAPSAASRDVPRWLWASVLAGVLLGCGVAWTARRLMDRAPQQGALSAMEDLLDVAPLVGGNGEAQDGLEDAPLVAPGRASKRSPAGQSLSNAFRGNQARGAARPSREDAEAGEAQLSAPAPAEQQSESAAGDTASEPATAAEQLRRPSF